MVKTGGIADEKKQNEGSGERREIQGESECE
jgi:hypothetical protein